MPTPAGERLVGGDDPRAPRRAATDFSEHLDLSSLALFAGADAFTPQRYQDEIHRLILELHALLPVCGQRLEARTRALVRDNLGVLTACFYGNALTPEALEVLHHHLSALSRLLVFRSSEGGCAGPDDEGLTPSDAQRA